MAEEIIDFEGLRINIIDNNDKRLDIETFRKTNQFVYVGQLIDLRVDLPLSPEGKQKFQNTAAPRSPVVQNLLTTLKRQLSTGVDVKCNIRGIPDSTEFQNGYDSKSQWKYCSVKTSFCEKHLTGTKKPDVNLSKGCDVYNVPVQVRVPEISYHCDFVELTVEARPICRQGPSWLSSPTRSDPNPAGEPGQTKDKKVTEKLRIIHPPDVKFQQKNVTGKQMIFLQVKNVSSREMRIDQCSILPEACLKSSGSQACSQCKGGTGENRTVCVLHANLVKLMPPGGGDVFPISLAPGECYSLCYTLNTSNCMENLGKDDLSLESHIKWCVPRNGHLDTSSVIVSTYRLPMLRMKKAYFVMCATCDKEDIKKGDSFVVNYSITNKLQDFLSIKLHWNPILLDNTEEAKRNLEKIQEGLVCQDPSIHLGPCTYGSTVQAQVRFQCVRAGLYEVCKHLKINLRYLIPSSETPSLASPSSQASTLSEDHLVIASEELWRSRSGSGSSFNDPRVASAEERRLSFANKSYSFGDLGPTKSSESSDSFIKDKFKHADRSPSGMKRDLRTQLTANTRYEQMLLCPENFIKNSCLVYVSGAGLCEIPASRLLTDFGKQFPVPHPLRHPQPAHSHTADMRTAMANFSLSGMSSSLQPFSSLALTPIRNPVSGITITAPVLPYPAVPFPALSLGAQGHEMPNLGFYNPAVRPPTANDPNKAKTPINRNYLELAMLVCNTFRGKLFPCPHCRYVTDRRNNLKRHISTMHQACDKLLECCGVSFSTKASLREHIMIFHHNGYSCPYCGRRFCRKALLKRHLSVHSGQKDYTCPCCDYATSHKSNLERHKRIHDRMKLGDDDGYLNCSSFSGHPHHQSPDTTGNSCNDGDPTGDNCVDIDSDDSCSEIEVTDDNNDLSHIYGRHINSPGENPSMGCHGNGFMPSRKHDVRETISFKESCEMKCDSTDSVDTDVPLNLQVTQHNDKKN